MYPSAIVAAAYLIGSIPFGYLIVRLRGGGDVRETGSGGTGATNVTRRAGRGAGVLTLLLDALKGTLVVLLARRFVLAPEQTAQWWVAASALAVVLGHIFPVWLGFRGGKGVATGLGVFLLLAPTATVFAALVFLVVVWRWRFVSLGSITACAALPVGIWLWSVLTPQASVEPLAPLLTAALLGSAFIIYMHRANIARLLSGTENRLK
ncbi:MAG TPA: glycerol-3-phosphate 1-O-acyltransferase PlsY [Pyrinomonadaceae bacterium]|jgi:glycerol-3-phosphate acyltransferase PlsY